MFDDLAPIRRGEETALGGILRAIGDDIKGKRLAAGERPHIDFLRCPRTHFARFAILNDPDRGAGLMRLLFASVYDGDLDGHLAELVAATSDMDATWGGCEGYSGVASFGAFVRRHALEPAGFYIAFRDETVASIQRAIGGDRRLRRPSLFSRLVAACRRVIRALPIAMDVVRAVGRFGFAQVSQHPQDRRHPRPDHRLSRVQLAHAEPSAAAPLAAFERRSRHRAPLAPLVPGDELPFVPAALPPALREDLVAQNELTLVTVVRPGSANRVRAVLAAIDSYAKRLAPPGSLIGVSTIHFVRWLLIDDARRLVLLSDYDNSWESYIDEFAELILSGLDAIWETSLGYPPDGARDVPALKRFLRAQQVRADVFYSAYPDDTVLNIVDATAG